MKMLRVVLALALIGCLYAAQSATAATLKADYQFNNTHASSVAGAPDISDIGAGSNTFASETVGGVSRTVLTFPKGNGLSVSTNGLIPSDSYTVVIDFRFAENSSWRRILDFQDGTSDDGLYNLNGDLQFYPVATGSGAPITTSQSGDPYHEVVLSRDGVSGTVTGSVDGVQQIQFADNSGLAVISADQILRFFKDDSQVPNEESAGAVSEIRLYDGPTSTTQSLTVNKAGSGSGSVSSVPAGISCGGTCSAPFNTGTQVTLTATPAAGSTFAGWTGDCSGTGTCQVTMDQARSVTATFTPAPPASHTLTVGKAGTGSGTVTSSPAGITCGATCSASFGNGTQVTLTPSAAAGSAFSGWSGACSGTGPCQVTLDQDRAVTATFDTVPVISGPGGVAAGDLFCGVQHRGKCKGLKIKTEFASPGNAVWQFAAYNPSPGHATARDAAKKVVVLGTLKRQIKQAGRVTIVFKLKPGARTRRLYRQVLKLHLKTIRVQLNFTTPSGQHLSATRNVKLRR